MDAAGITAELTYTIDTGIKPVNETFGPGNIRRRTSGTTEQRPVRIRRARFTAHTSFVDPTTAPGAPPRQSIEARTLAFFA